MREPSTNVSGSEGDDSGMRTISVPSTLQILSDVENTVEVCCRLLGSLGSRVLIVSTPTPYNMLGRLLEQRLGARVLIAQDNSLAQVQAIAEETLNEETHAIIGVGGGKAIDVAKLAAHHTRCRFISIPTQASHDGLASPVAVIQHPVRGSLSIGATMPEAVLVPVNVVMEAPGRTINSGLGDLFAKRSALLDWRLAVSVGRDSYDDYAALMAEASVAYVSRFIAQTTDVERLCRTESFVSLLVRGLILSGLSMAIAGSSRPASGSEHLISHAIDTLYGGRYLHGEQVAVGTIVSLVMHGLSGEAGALAGLYRRVGLPVTWRDLGLTDGQFAEVLKLAPRTRPRRYTILDRADLCCPDTVISQVDKTLSEAVSDTESGWSFIGNWNLVLSSDQFCCRSRA